MNGNEKQILSKITHRGGNVKDITTQDHIIYRRNGSFTVAIVVRGGGFMGVGATKRHPKDLDKPGLARNIAFARAVRDRGE